MELGEDLGAQPLVVDGESSRGADLSFQVAVAADRAVVDDCCHQLAVPHDGGRGPPSLITWFHLPARRVDEPLGTVEPVSDFDVLVAQRATEGGAERSRRRCSAEVVNEAANGPRGPIPAPGIEAHARREDDERAAADEEQARERLPPRILRPVADEDEGVGGGRDRCASGRCQHVQQRSPSRLG